MPATAFINGRVLTDRGFVADLAVIVEGDRISDVRPGTAPRGMTTIDLGGNYLAPGFIDTQVNGGGDVLFNADPTIDGIARIAAAHRRYGTTGLLPTLISDDAGVTAKAIAAVRQAIIQGVPGVLGIHLEGPYLAAERKGVHDPRRFHTPTDDELDAATSLDTGLTMLTLAPERFEPDRLRALAARGVILSAGHTTSSYEQMRSALHAGVRGVTHLFNAMTPLTSREPGAVGAALEDADSWCGIIVDGYHVHDAALRVALAAKQPGKLMLVTDAMPPVGGARPDFSLHGVTISCRDGRCATPDGVLAGSALDMASAVRNTVRRLGVPLAESCRMASAYPAAFLGLDQERGRIAPGFRADLVAFDDAVAVRGTWVGGTARDAPGAPPG